MFRTHPRSSWSRLTTTTSAAPMTMTMTGYNLWFHRDRGSLSTGRQLEMSYATVRGILLRQARTRPGPRTDHDETTERYHSLYRTPRACTMKRETDIRWQRRQRAKGRKRFPASTTDTALAPRYTRRGTAHARRRLDSAHAHASRPHLFLCFRCKTQNSRARRNFREYVTFPLLHASNVFLPPLRKTELRPLPVFELRARGSDVPTVDLFQLNYSISTTVLRNRAQSCSFFISFFSLFVSLF